jgi:transcriptional antiterminator NusG
MADYWYALHVPTGSEEKVKHILERQVTSSFKFVIYKRRMKERKSGRWHMIDRKLFPGYILMNGLMTDEAWQEMREADTSFHMLRSEDDYLTLSMQEIKMLGILDENADGLINVSKAIISGDKVVVTDGPLVGQETLIVSVDKRKGRVKVKVNFCGSERIVELAMEVIEKV